MFDEKTNQPYTAHSLNKVPAILTMKDVQLHEGTLADVAPTILKVLSITKPEAMTGTSLF